MIIDTEFITKYRTLKQELEEHTRYIEEALQSYASRYMNIVDPDWFHSIQEFEIEYDNTIRFDCEHYDRESSYTQTHKLPFSFFENPSISISLLLMKHEEKQQKIKQQQEETNKERKLKQFEQLRKELNL